MKQSIKHFIPGLLAVMIAISVGFISGYWAAPNKSAKPVIPSTSQGITAEALQSIKEPGFVPSVDNGPKPGDGISYTPEHPSLMGLTLSNTFDDVTTRYGKPDSQYVQNEGGEPLIIYHYPQFTVGLGENRKVYYIEISGKGSDPGLNGLQLGSSQAAAVQALGEPSTDSGYVLTYQTEDTILKLDIDPVSDTIQSIKLFNRNDQ